MALKAQVESYKFAEVPHRDTDHIVSPSHVIWVSPVTIVVLILTYKVPLPINVQNNQPIFFPYEKQNVTLFWKS